MKVLHILNLSIPNNTGYAVRSKYILEFQKQMSIEPYAVTSPKYDHLPVYEEINGISYWRSRMPDSGLLSFLGKIPVVKERVITYVLAKNIEKICLEKRPDVIQAYSPSLCGMAGLMVAGKLNIPFVYEVRAFWEDAAVDQGKFKEGSLKYNLSRLIETHILKRADIVTSICQGLRDDIFSRTRRKDIYIVPNGVDTKLFVPCDKNILLLDKFNLKNRIIVGFIGSFFRFEGLEVLIRAAVDVYRTNPNIAFIVVGAGLEDDNARELARSIGIINKNVFFTGRVPHENILDYYSVCDILVYPRISLRITELVTPLKPLEAMSMEKAVIVSDVGGLKELIKEGQTALTFKSGDFRDLAEKIIELSNNETMRLELGKQARKDMVKNRDWSILVPKYIDIYNRLTNFN